MVQKNEVNFDHFDNVFHFFGTKNHNHLGLHDHFLIPLLFFFIFATVPASTEYKWLHFNVTKLLNHETAQCGL